jgi:two-component system response regulator
MIAKTILLVEDNPSDIALTQRAFAKSRIANELLVAEDGQEALEYLFATGKHNGRDVNQLPAADPTRRTHQPAASGDLDHLE